MKFRLFQLSINHYPNGYNFSRGSTFATKQSIGSKGQSIEDSGRNAREESLPEAQGVSPFIYFIGGFLTADDWISIVMRQTVDFSRIRSDNCKCSLFDKEFWRKSLLLSICRFDWLIHAISQHAKRSKMINEVIIIARDCVIFTSFGLVMENRSILIYSSDLP